MFKDLNIQQALQSQRKEGEAEALLRETRRILKQDLFAEKKILDHLKQYNRTFEVMSEEDAPSSRVFTIEEIRRTAVQYRMKYLESGSYKPEIPYEAVSEIKALNRKFGKELKHFFILTLPAGFRDHKTDVPAVLFTKTNYDNYFLVHQWGPRLKWHRKLMSWPLRRFETLFITVLSVTLLITMMLPTRLITLDSSADYWSGYRAAAFFHLLIFNMGVTAYVTFAFSKNFSDSTWNRFRDF